MAREKSKSDLETEKVNAAVLKQNDRILTNMSKKAMKRHVTEENEPVFDEILDNFRNSYGKTVAAKSALDILKFVKSEL